MIEVFCVLGFLTFVIVMITNVLMLKKLKNLGRKELESTKPPPQQFDIATSLNDELNKLRTQRFGISMVQRDRLNHQGDRKE
jgi:hypothetical protein